MPRVASSADLPPPGWGMQFRRQARRLALLALIPFATWFVYWWFIERVEVHANEMLIVINKGERLSAPPMPATYGDQSVLYPALVKAVAAQLSWTEEKVRDEYPGIRYEVLHEGRYFLSPVWYEYVKRPATLIPAGKFGVLVRKYGRPLPPGHTVATSSDERGPVSGTLEPGRHDINPFAYDVQVFDQVVVPEGHIGIKTLLSGPDAAEPNNYVVKSGERGVQPDTLGPGTYRNFNPHEVRIDLVDARSHKYDMLGDDAIEFPSNDGFNIHMEATVEWAVYGEHMPWVMVEIGDLEDVVSKVIRPYTMSLSRIQGSKQTARQYIGAREEFQRRLTSDLRQKCEQQGIHIKSVNVRDLKPPEQIRSVIRERELADQTISRYQNEINEANARALLVEQEELAAQNQAIGDANKEVVTLTTSADQSAAVAITEASQKLDVAKLELEAARKQAEAILARGQAESEVVLFGFKAQAEPLRASVAAFGDGKAYAQYQFYQKLAPAIRSILTDTQGPLADILGGFAPRAAADKPVVSAGKRPRNGTTDSEVATPSDSASDGKAGGQ